MEPTIEKKSNGALVGIIIIVIILIIGGIYMWMTKASKLMPKEEVKEETLNDEATPVVKEEVNTPSADETYNELNQIEQDLNASETSMDVDVSKVQ